MPAFLDTAAWRGADLIELEVNGRTIRVPSSVDPATKLADYLRDHVGIKVLRSGMRPLLNSAHTVNCMVGRGMVCHGAERQNRVRRGGLWRLRSGSRGGE